MGDILHNIRADMVSWLYYYQFLWRGIVFAWGKVVLIWLCGQTAGTPVLYILHTSYAYTENLTEQHCVLTAPPPPITVIICTLGITRQ